MGFGQLCFVVIGLLLVGGVSAKTDDDVINVHLVCHTHDDVGWLKTVDQYYVGANNSIQHAGVQYVIDSVIQHLQEDPRRKFIYVEIAFFMRWWREQTPETKGKVRKLVQDGQLEFINGGWAMNDEATTWWVDIIDQMTLGHAFLIREFGVKPRIGWHIDPFGHSSVQASLFASMGFDAFFFGRVDYDDKSTRLAQKTMEFVWRGSPSLGRSTEIFSGVLYNGYGPPDGFCFDQFCDDPPIVDDPTLYEYNVDKRAAAFVAAAKDQVSHFRTNHIMMTMGSDFQYENANLWFKNLEKLMNYINARPEFGVKVFYSTPSEYVDALNAKNLQWTSKTDDFFPYADGPHAFWTGYFVSRPALKGYVRKMSNHLQTCRQLEALTLKKRDATYPLASLELSENMGIAQHHDAVSGTEKQHVAYDYALRLSNGEAKCDDLIMQVIGGASTGTPVSLGMCKLLNESTCDYTEKLQAGQSVNIILYNSLAQPRNDFIRVPVAGAGTYTVTDQSGKTVPSQVESSISLYGSSSDKGLLTFQASVQGLATAQYTIARGTTRHSAHTKTATTGSIENEHLKLDFGAAGLSAITNKDLKQTTQASQSILWYRSSEGTPDDGQPSGAYIFRPISSTPDKITDTPTVAINQGSLVQEAVVTWAPWAVQVYRLYAGAKHVEVEYQIGPIPANDVGKEVVTRFSTDLNTSATFYTDNNGREMAKRVRDFRETWSYRVTEPVSGNYYPMNAAAYIQDDARKLRFTILNDRSQAAASIADGQLEVMLHRRTLRDDWRGVGEPINEPGIDGNGLVIRTQHYLLFDAPDNSALLHRTLEQQLNLPLTPFFAPSGNVALNLAGTALPPNVHLLTLSLYADLDGTPVSQDSTYYVALFRLAHLFEVNEHPDLSKPATVDLRTVFSQDRVYVVSALELSLSANQRAQDVRRLQWNSGSSRATEAEKLSPSTFDPASLVVTLNPMEIKTFMLVIKTA